VGLTVWQHWQKCVFVVHGRTWVRVLHRVGEFHAVPGQLSARSDETVVRGAVKLLIAEFATCLADSWTTAKAAGD